MKIKPILADMSGRLQGIVASHNRGGQYFRGRTVPIAPPTAPQTAVRLALANLVGDWKGVLTDAERQDWNTYASINHTINGFGDSINAGGLGLFLRFNIARGYTALGRVNTPPSGSGVAFLTPPTPSESGGDIEVAFNNSDPWANDDNGALLIYASGPVPVTRYSAAGISKVFVAKIVGNSVTPPTSPATITSTPPWPTGFRRFFKFQAIVSDGSMSAFFETKADS